MEKKEEILFNKAFALMIGAENTIVTENYFYHMADENNYLSEREFDFSERSPEAYNQACEFLEEGLKECSNPKIFLNYLGVCQWNMDYENHLEDAIKNLSKAIELDPSYGSAYFNRGKTYHKAYSYRAEALLNFNAAVELGVNEPNIYLLRGCCKYFLKDNEGALSDFNHYVELKPNDMHGYDLRADLKHTMKDYHGAIADHVMVMGLDDNHLCHLLSIANVYTFMKNHEAAINLHSYLIENSEPNCGYYFFRGEVYQSAGLYKEALADFTSAINITNDVDPYYVKRAKVKGELGDIVGEEEDLTRAIEIHPGQEQYIDRGVARVRLQNYSEAANDFSEALVYNPSFVDAYMGKYYAESRISKNH